MAKVSVKDAEGPGTESVKVTAWACSICGNVSAVRKRADECCTYSHCGKKFKKEHYTSTCPSCAYGTDLRNARSEALRSRDRYNDARDRLERLIKDPPPGKRQLKSAAVPPRDESYVHLDGVVDVSAWAPLCEARDWLRELAESLKESSSKIGDGAEEMAERIQRGIERTGGRSS